MATINQFKAIIMNTEESFKELLKVKGLAKKLGLLKCNVSIWKGISEGKHPNKKLPSKEMMEKILNQYGAKKVKEEEVKKGSEGRKDLNIFFGLRRAADTD